MKKLLTLVLALVFVLVVSSFVMAIGDSDTTYYITDDEPCYWGRIEGINELAAFDLEYYQNAETFLAVYQYIGSSSSGSELVVNLKGLGVVGSYLFNSGIFVRVGADSEIIDMNDGVLANSFLIAPGYRFDFDEKSYLAGYVEYSKSSALDEGNISFHVYGKQFTDTMKITEELRSFTDYPSWANVRVNYKISEKLVVGGGLQANWDTWGDFSISLSEGVSYSTDRLIANFTLSGNMENLISFYGISAIYYFTDSLGFGATCSDSFGSGGGTPSFSYKGKYRMDRGNLVLKFSPLEFVNTWSIEYQRIL